MFKGDFELVREIQVQFEGVYQRSWSFGFLLVVAPEGKGEKMKKKSKKKEEGKKKKRKIRLTKVGVDFPSVLLLFFYSR